MRFEVHAYFKDGRQITCGLFPTLAEAEAKASEILDDEVSLSQGLGLRVVGVFKEWTFAPRAK